MQQIKSSKDDILHTSTIATNSIFVTAPS